MAVVGWGANTAPVVGWADPGHGAYAAASSQMPDYGVLRSHQENIARALANAQNQPNQDELDEQRWLLFNALVAQRGLADTPFAQGLQQSVESGVRGELGPITPEIEGFMKTDLADTGAGAYRAGREQLEQQAAQSGTKVGGALLGLQSGINAATRAGFRDISTRAAAMNSARQQAAQVDAMRLLQQRLDNEWRSRQAEAAYRAQIHATMQQPAQQQQGQTTTYRAKPTNVWDPGRGGYVGSGTEAGQQLMGQYWSPQGGYQAKPPADPYPSYDEPKWWEKKGAQMKAPQPAPSDLPGGGPWAPAQGPLTAQGTFGPNHVSPTLVPGMGPGPWAPKQQRYGPQTTYQAQSY